MPSISVPGLFRGRKAWAWLAAGIVLLILLVNAMSAIFGGMARTNAGEIGVVRNGGPLDNNNIRQVMDPSSEADLDRPVLERAQVPGAAALLHDHRAGQRATSRASTSCTCRRATASTWASKGRCIST
ncbi:hypothetical protein ACU686_30725 [Yinghuangia aomiensis]